MLFVFDFLVAFESIPAYSLAAFRKISLIYLQRVLWLGGRDTRPLSSIIKKFVRNFVSVSKIIFVVHRKARKFKGFN